MTFSPTTTTVTTAATTTKAAATTTTATTIAATTTTITTAASTTKAAATTTTTTITAAATKRFGFQQSLALDHTDALMEFLCTEWHTLLWATSIRSPIHMGFQGRHQRTSLAGGLRIW